MLHVCPVRGVSTLVAFPEPQWQLRLSGIREAE
jgi:hypothetical protein